jgi:hypothetical protein
MNIKNLLLVIFFGAFTLVANGQVQKQVLDARIKGIKSEDELLKIESSFKKYPEILKSYHVFKGPESYSAKLVVEIKIDERGEQDHLFCSEDLKKIIVSNGFEPLSIKEYTLNLNQEFPNYDKNK